MAARHLRRSPLALALIAAGLACEPQEERVAAPDRVAAGLSAARPSLGWSRSLTRFLVDDARRVFADPERGGFVAHRPGLRLFARPAGFELAPPAERPAWRLTVRLSRLEAGGVARALPAAKLSADGARLRWEHAGLVAQEIENREEAVEQVLHMIQPQGERFALGLALEGAGWEIAAGGLSVRHAGDEVLRATAPRAFEAGGRELPCAFACRDGLLWIEVRDARRYPVTIDPAWSSSGEDRDLSRFGWSLAGVGDVNGDGRGDVVVSAPFFSTANTAAGKVYLFYGQADGLAAAPAWSASGDNVNRAYFGYSVSPAGDINQDGYADFAVGAPGEDGTQTDAGRAFVFMGSRNGPGATAAWASSGFDEAGASYGTTVAAAGDVDADGYPDLIVGAPAQSMETGPTSGTGAAFLYRGTAQGLSTGHAWSSRGDEAAGSGFGWSVAGAGDVDGDGRDDAIVGAYLYQGAYQAQGRAYLFLGAPGGLAATYAWSASGDAQAFAQFGFSVDGAGDVDGDGYADVIVGAPGHDTASGNAGRVYAYRGGTAGTGLPPTSWWRYSGTDRAGALFGWSVAGAGDVNADGKDDVIVGAPGEDTLGTGAGRAFLYSGALSGPLTPPAWASSGDDQAGAAFGTAVAAAGDVNADGAADLLASAPYEDIPGQEGGRAFLFLGVKENPGLCEPVGSPCDDLDPCTHTDVCDAAGACRGTAFSCDDQNPCTTDECRGDGTCGHLHNTDPCDDGNPCTEGDVCAATQCVGTPRDCSWLDDACTQGACDPGSGTCQALPRPDGTPCDDGDACTGGDACRGGTCAPVDDLCGGDGGCASAGGRGGPCALLLALALLLHAAPRPGRGEPRRTAFSRPSARCSACSRGRRA